MENDDNGQRVSPVGEQLDELTEDYLSDFSSDASIQTGHDVSTKSVVGNDESPSVTSTPNKKPPNSRPNKHHGPDSTWRSRTASERQLAASLDQLRAKDLGIHLYNFYALKRQQIREEGESNVSRDWVSSKSWTAWPMTPELVPRESDANSCEDDAGQGAFIPFEQLSSHETMQDLLAAQVAKKAKERLSKREWEDADVVSPSPPSDRESRYYQYRIQKAADDSSSGDDDEPVVLADDQLARSILQPSLNHVMTKLDTLLTGLRHARSSYASTNKSSLRLHTIADSEYSTDDKRKRKTVSREVSRKSKHRRKGSSAKSEDMSSTEDELSSARGRRSGSDRKRTQQPSRSRSRFDRLGLRDWSDVLGIASMCGWDAEVVKRTAARCSALFDETMTFRTLHEGYDEHRISSFVPKKSTAKDPEIPMLSPLQKEQNPDGRDNDLVGGVHVDGFLQPIPKHSSWSRKRKPRKK